MDETNTVPITTTMLVALAIRGIKYSNAKGDRRNEIIKSVLKYAHVSGYYLTWSYFSEQVNNCLED